MIGLVQRLLDRSAALPASVPPVQPAARSVSPLIEHDQRLLDPAFQALLAAPGLAPGAGREAPFADPAPDAVPPDRPPSMERAASLPGRTTAPAAPAAMDAPPSGAGPERRSPGEPPTPAFDPIAALRRADAGDPVAPRPARPLMPAQERPRDLPDPGSRQQSPAPNYAPAKAAALPARPPAGVSRSIPAPLASAPFASALPPLAAPDTPPVAAPRALVSPAPAVAARMLETPAPVRPDLQPPQPARPAMGMNPVARPSDPVAALAPAPAVAQGSGPASRVVERIVTERPTPGPEAPRERPAPVTAASVSRIGNLPERRRAHTLFGLRRP